MTKEEKQNLEAAAAQARDNADEAHDKAAANTEDKSLQDAADQLEDAAVAAQNEADEAVVDGEIPDSDDDEIDFEKELENLAPPTPTPSATPKSELEKAETALHFNAKRVSELGGDPKKILGVPAESIVPAVVIPPTPGNFVTKEELDNRDLQTELRKLAKSDAEYQVLVYHTQHSIRQTGNPTKDAENAYLIAHKGRITRSFEELRRATFVRTAPGQTPGRRAPAAPTQAPRLNADEMNMLKRRGFKQMGDGSWESKRRKLAFDPKKKSWTETMK